ncbi:Helix-turn-helix domain protein [compost metagenome]
MAPENLLTVQQVMEKLQLSRATIYRLIDQGKLVPRKIGKSVRFIESDVDAFIRQDQA